MSNIQKQIKGYSNSKTKTGAVRNPLDDCFYAYAMLKAGVKREGVRL